MYKTGLSLILLLSVSFGIYAQSGRKMEPKPKTEATKPADGELNESTVNPDGETVEGDVIRFDTALVTVPVTVLDRNGRYVPLLRKDQFRLAENGVDQKIAYFATTDSPFSVILLIDTSGSTQMRLDDIQNAAIKFVEKLKPTDSVMVMSFDDRIQVQCKATTDRDVIEKAIRRTRTGGGTRLYDAVDDILRKQLRTITGRKAVVLFTDGVDTTSYHASYDSTVRDAEELDALIYSVAYDDRGGAGSLGGDWGSSPRIPLPGGGGIPMGRPNVGGGGTTSPAEYERGRMYLSELARVTGGRLYNGSSMLGLSQAFAYVADELRRQYSLGYYPRQSGQAAQRRRLKVRVNQPN